LELEPGDIQRELDRRRPGQSAISTRRKEKDRVRILSGVFQGKTTGAPISLMVLNEDVQSGPYEATKDMLRPGHADYALMRKYGFRDWRGGGRSSAREQLGRVAAGAVAKKVLARRAMTIVGFTRQVGSLRIADDELDLSAVEKNPVRAAHQAKAVAMQAMIEKVRKGGDSIGGVVEVIARGVPAGLGEPVFDKLSADLAKAVMSIGAVKGVEIGDGFKLASMKGSQSNDPIGKKGFQSNHAGGLLGGMSTGQDIVLRAAFKPTPSIAKTQATIDLDGREVKMRLQGRFDPCVCPRAVPVVEAMVALVLVDHVLRQDAYARP